MPALKLYLRRTTTNAASAPSSEQSTTQPNGTASSVVFACHDLNVALGIVQAALVVTNTHAADTIHRDGLMRMFASDALSAVTIAAGTWRVGLSGTISNSAAATYHNVIVYVWRPGTGAKVGTIFDSHQGTGFGGIISDGRQILSFSGSSVVCQAGDRIIFEWWHHWTQTMATAYTSNIRYDDGAELDDVAATEGSWIEVPQDDIFSGGGAALTQDVNDTLSLADALVFERQVVLPDTLSLTDVLAFQRQNVIPDTLSLADATKFDREIVLPGDSVTPSDGATQEVGRTQAVNDTVSLADAILFERGIVIADTLSLADAVKFDREMTLADTLSLADAVRFERMILLADTLSLSDSALGETGKEALVADTLSLADGILFERGITIADTLSLADTISFVREILLADALSLADAIAFQYGLTVADVLSLADLADPVKTAGGGTDWEQAVDDTLSLADALSFIRNVVVEDSVTIQDSNARQKNGLFLPDGSVAVSTSRGVIRIGRF